MTTNTNAALREKLIDMIAEHLSGTYRCLRVWEAWNFGTMSQDDFDDVGESDTPPELADAILAAISTAAQPPAGCVVVPIELAKRVQETISEFLMDHDWRQIDMDTSDALDAVLAAAPKAEPAPSDYADAYQGAREDLAIWKRRALEAESALRTEQKASSRLAAEVNEANGPTHLGEPVQPERVPLTEAQLKQIHHITIAAMFHSGEEIEGPDGLAMMVDMSVWNDALDAFEGIIGDEMEPAKEQA